MSNTQKSHSFGAVFPKAVIHNSDSKGHEKVCGLGRHRAHMPSGWIKQRWDDFSAARQSLGDSARGSSFPTYLSMNSSQDVLTIPRLCKAHPEESWSVTFALIQYFNYQVPTLCQVLLGMAIHANDGEDLSSGPSSPHWPVQDYLLKSRKGSVPFVPLLL